MDPNKTLRDIRTEIARIEEIENRMIDGPTRYEVQARHALNIAELFANLDEWLRNKGFMPEEWNAR